MIKHGCMAVLVAAAAWAGTAGIASAAQWPSSVVGGWDAYANNAHLTLRISTQAASGACKAITGKVTDLGSKATTPIRGYYCPGSGSISFLRNDRSTGDTFQVYRGNLSFANAAQVRMGGSFAEYNSAGFLGEYNFQAAR